VAGAFVVDAERGAKRRQDGFPGGSRKAANVRLREIMTVTACSLEIEAGLVLAPCDFLRGTILAFFRNTSLCIDNKSTATISIR